MNLSKNKIILFGIIFLFTLTSCFNTDYNLIKTEIQEESQLRLSDPKNSTFQHIDFENDTIGQDPTGFTLSVDEPTGCTANIEDLGDGQQKHLALHKVGSVGRVWVRDNFSLWNNETYTTGEYHLKVYHDNSGFGINLNSANMEYILAMVWNNGEIRDDVGGTLLATYTLNQWSDVVIYFNLSLGWMFDLDGVRYGEGYSIPFFGAFTANAEHIWMTSFVSGGGDGYFRVDDIAFYPPISIITPGNKTYNETMRGHYPSTFGFENDTVGTSPKGWINQDGLSCTSEIISELGGHKKILRQTDNSNGLGAVLNYTFTSARDHGTVEFFARVSVITPGTRMWLDLNSASGQEIWITMGDSSIKYEGGGPWYDIIPSGITADTWYHFSIRWRNTGAPAYEALGEGEWKIFIDGVEYGNYDLVYDDNMTSINLESGAAPFNHITYWDAIGFDWEDGYDIGDNLNEGLLLTFEKDITFDWVGYSLDDQTIRTVLGNSTIPMPEEGIHTIQLFAKDSLGVLYKSSIRYFTVDFPIDIITPEAKSYSAPMSGYYPATYGFESDLPGTDAKNWTHVVLGGTHSYIVDSYKGHERVYEMYDNAAGNPDTYTNFNNQLSGTVEGWVLVTLSDYVIYLDINQDTSPVVRLLFKTGEYLIAWNNSVAVNMTEFGIIQEDQWYHIRVDFRSALAGAYMGLAGDSYRFYLNGVQCNSDLLVNLPSAQFNRVTFLTGWSAADPNYYAYFDAVGFSWDPYYNIGDNLNEGLLLSFENSTALDWIGYSLDGQTNKTILGNTTIPLPADRLHSIRVFGNDSLGAVHQSNIRRFSVYSINIINPEDKIYTQPMTGYYPATYGFENDKDGEQAQGWWTENEASCDSQIIDNYNGHNDVYELSDNNPANKADVTNSFENKTYGTIEVWFLHNATSYYSGIYISYRDPFVNMISIQIIPGDYLWLYNSTNPNPVTFPELGIIQAGSWYHLRVDFRIAGSPFYMGLSEDSYIVSINGIKANEELTLTNTGYPINELNFHTGYSSAGLDQLFYFDAVGFSWDPNYNIGDNLNEGLLLSFENITALNWTGYSLDYQPISTILGNVTIPMPSNGLHSIQVFGNDSLGTMYKSDIRLFTVNTIQIVDLIAPVITINLPELNTLFGTDAPPYDLTIIETNLNSMWYTLDGGLVNTTIVELNGTLALSIWTNRPNGTVDIRFYADDLAGNVGFEEVEIRKDILPPQITINTPIQNKVFYDTAPSFDLTIIEGNLDVIWHTLDDGIVNFSCGISGNINNFYWNAIPPGSYVLKFYAKDTLGNLGFSEVTIKKKERDIPGYNPFLLSLIIIAGIMIISLKIKKKSK